MKRLHLLFIAVLLVTLLGCTSKMGTKQATKADLKLLENNLQTALSKNGQELKIQVSELKNISDTLPGFSFVEIKIYDKDNLVNTDKVITNGQFFAKDIVDSKTLTSLKDELDFEFAKIEQIDTSKLTLAGGSKDSKNVIIEITDFQCPYCKKANGLLKQKLSDNKSDYALYIVHLPLDMHPSAQIMAQIFEAGMQMGYNFKNELFEADYIRLLETKIAEEQKAGVQLNQEIVDKFIKEINNTVLNDYATKTNDPDKFKTLVNSENIKAKITESKNLAESLNINSTPAFYINGKAIAGYNENLIIKALDSFK